MAASHNVPEVPNSSKYQISKTGVLTLFGYGIRVRMQSGHLEIEDGTGSHRRRIRLARIGHRLRRLVCIAEDGFFTIDALRWLGDQQASLILLDRSGKVSLITGPIAPSDARLRRAQSLAHETGAALEIMRELMHAKLDGQEQLVRKQLSNVTAADIIATLQKSVSTAENLDAIARSEAHAAVAYWSAWSQLSINFPRQDITRVPENWRTFGTRKSAITGSARLATNPPNAILNYCYSLLESETRLAISAVGLDPGIGILHVDTPNRDSLACDIMETVRPAVDAWLLDWIMQEPFRRSDFFEERNGNCRLLKGLTSKLGETMPIWRKLVAPWAEYVARTLWTRASSNGSSSIPTRLTQRHRRESKGVFAAPTVVVSKPERVCRGCGKSIKSRRSNCSKCAIADATKRLVEVARMGRIAALAPEALAREGETQRRHAKARASWSSSSQPDWLTPQFYSDKIQPLLVEISSSSIASHLGVSRWYSGRIREGYRPHQRHWLALAQLVGISESDPNKFVTIRPD